MKLGNGMGGISKLSGNRRKPYCSKVTIGWIYDEEKHKKRQIQKVIGYYKTKKEALEALVLYNRDPYDLDGRSVTFDECYKNIKFTETRAKQYDNAYRYLAPLKDKPIRSITPAALQECIDSCQNSQQPLVKTICKRVYEYAMMHEYVDKDPSQYVKAVAQKAKIQREVFSSEEIAELWTYTDQWWAVVTLILLYSGMRTKELKDLSAEDIDIENRTINIPKAKNDCSCRTIPIHKRILPLISTYKSEGLNLYGYCHGNLNRYLHEFHGHRAHDCRHTFTTRMREVGVDHLTIQRLVGHTPTSITERVYTHISMEELTDAIDKLEY